MEILGCLVIGSLMQHELCFHERPQGGYHGPGPISILTCFSIMEANSCSTWPWGVLVSQESLFPPRTPSRDILLCQRPGLEDRNFIATFYWDYCPWRIRWFFFSWGSQFSVRFSDLLLTTLSSALSLLMKPLAVGAQLRIWSPCTPLPKPLRLKIIILLAFEPSLFQASMNFPFFLVSPTTYLLFKLI